MKKFTPLLYFFAAFIFSLCLRYIFKNQPNNQALESLIQKDTQEKAVILPDQVSYNFDVKPILSDKCYTCHGPDPKSVQGEFRLDIKDNW